MSGAAFSGGARGHTAQTSPTRPEVGITGPGMVALPILAPGPRCLLPHTQGCLRSHSTAVGLGAHRCPSLRSTPSHHALMMGWGAPAFPGTMSWFDMAQLLTTLTTASRLTLAPLTWTWPCSIEMLVEVGAWAGGGRRRRVSPPFLLLESSSAAADCGGASSPQVSAPGGTWFSCQVPAILHRPPLQALPRSPAPAPCCSHSKTFSSRLFADPQVPWLPEPLMCLPSSDLPNSSRRL